MFVQTMTGLEREILNLLVLGSVTWPGKLITHDFVFVLAPCLSLCLAA